VLLALSQRTGEALVHLSTADFTQVAYFGLAYGGYVAAGQALWHYVVSFAPMLIGWKEQGDATAMGHWLQRLATRLVAGAVLIAAVMILAGRLAIETILGPQYAPVAESLAPLSVALIALTVASLNRLRALVADRPGVAAVAASLELAAFWGVAAALAPQYGSYGAAVAVLAGVTLNALFSTWRLRGDLAQPLILET
jgi:O-antigen/teichoic acid export membrane protein